LRRSGVMENWLMSKSKVFGPGAMALLNVTFVQTTFCAG
jgi:hypothetical protein